MLGALLQNSSEYCRLGPRLSMALDIHDVSLQDPMVNRHVMFYEAEAFQFLDCLGFKIAPGRIEQTRELTNELLHLINPGIAASWHGFSLHRRFRSTAQHLMKPYPKGPST